MPSRTQSSNTISAVLWQMRHFIAFRISPDIKSVVHILYYIDCERFGLELGSVPKLCLIQERDYNSRLTHKRIY